MGRTEQMAQLLCETRSAGAVYRVIRAPDGHLLIQEAQARKRRSYRIRPGEWERIRAASEAARGEVAQAVYHEARLRRKARKRATGGNNGDQLVSSH